MCMLLVELGKLGLVDIGTFPRRMGRLNLLAVRQVVCYRLSCISTNDGVVKGVVTRVELVVIFVIW